MDSQRYIEADEHYHELAGIIRECGAEKILLVHGQSFYGLPIKGVFETMGESVVHFTGFSVNPKYEEAVEGRRIFMENHCDMIIAVGGGSAIDTAKCIKAFAGMPEGSDYLKERILNNEIFFIAIPTTAGTGSESTRFAVIYREGEKCSVSDDTLLPDMFLLDERLTRTMPEKQKKVTLCDALAHGIESYWSVHADTESREYAAEAIRLIMDNWEDYIFEEDGNHDNDDKDRVILKASNLAGKAINISMTTAGHAMSYKLTSMFGISHGQAVMLCLPNIWKHMNKKADKDTREIFEEIAGLLGCENVDRAVGRLEDMIEKMGLIPDFSVSAEQIEQLADSVNVERLSNNPIPFDREELRQMYVEILA